MVTECNEGRAVFQGIWRKPIVAGFDGGRITSDAGVLLLGQLERRFGYLRRFSECFEDRRDPRKVEHRLGELISQRVLGICLGYEDLNDHDRLRADTLLAAVCGKEDAEGKEREREEDRGLPLAGKSTLNRLELGTAQMKQGERYKKIGWDDEAVKRYFVDVFLSEHAGEPGWIILDLDATDVELHGHQEGRHFHGFYDCYCYLPLYIFCADHLLAAKLRPSDIDASAGALEEVQRIVAQIRKAWPGVKILLRADSGFCRDEIMDWCECEGVYYLFGLARNARLMRTVWRAMKKAMRRWAHTGTPQRVFQQFAYRTLDSWSRSRRVIAKAEYLEGKQNPRFVVTNLDWNGYPAQDVYEQIYCARGDMENRIKENQGHLFADRASAESMRANQFRLWLSSVAYLMLSALRRHALANTQMANAQCQTIRTKLMKIGAQVAFHARRVVVRMSSAYPFHKIFLAAFHNLAVDTG